MTTGVTVRAGREDGRKLLLRLTVGLLLLFHGVAKLGAGSYSFGFGRTH